jgi:hypothetical protein
MAASSLPASRRTEGLAQGQGEMLAFLGFYLGAGNIKLALS